MFENCKNLENIEPLAHWNVSKGTNFDCMFSNTSMKDIKPLVNWCVPEGYDVRNMFKYDYINRPSYQISKEQIEWLNKI